MVGRQGGLAHPGCLMDRLAGPSLSPLFVVVAQPPGVQGEAHSSSSALPGACQRPFQFWELWSLTAQQLCLIVTQGLLSPSGPHSWNVKVRSLEHGNPICLKCLTSETFEMLILCSLSCHFFPSWGNSFLVQCILWVEVKEIRFKGQININYFQIESIITVIRAKNSRCKVFETELGTHRYFYYI